MIEQCKLVGSVLDLFDALDAMPPATPSRDMDDVPQAVVKRITTTHQDCAWALSQATGISPGVLTFTLFQAVNTAIHAGMPRTPESAAWVAEKAMSLAMAVQSGVESAAN